MTTKTFSSWVKFCSWSGVSAVAVIGYLSQREWFVSATNSWAVGVFEGACLLIAASVLVNNYGDSLAEAYLGLRELGRLQKHKLRKK